MKKIFKRAIATVLALFSAFAVTGCTGGGGGGGGDDPKGETLVSPLTERVNAAALLSGQDELERKVTAYDPTSGNGRLVGVFYSLWLGNYYEAGTTYKDESKTERTGEYFHPDKPYFKHINNVGELLKTEAGRTQLYSLLSKDAQGENENRYENLDMYFWGEPLFGYYNNADPWVVDRHVRMFIAAGVDFLVIDTSNYDIFETPLTVLMNTLQGYKDAGFNAPKVIFLTNTNADYRVERLYNFMYKDNKWKDLWFCETDPNGGNVEHKPWIIAADVYKANLRVNYPQVYEKFYFKHSQWPNAAVSPNGFPWIDFTYPQHNFGGIMSVSVAQHPVGHMSDSVQFAIEPKYYNANHGRGYDFKTGANNKAGLASGTNYEQQWETAINDKTVKMVLITQWNEWAALKLNDNVKDPQDGTVKGKYACWFDCFDFEFSRDIEPTADGEYGDNYYMQTIKNIRAFKGVAGGGQKVQTATLPTYGIDGKAWDKVTTGVSDFTGVNGRNFADVLNNGNTYTNDTCKNNITEIRLAQDSRKLYILITCDEKITGLDDGNLTRMNVWLKTSGQSGNKLGYDFVINRKRVNGQASVEYFRGNVLHDGGYADFAVNGRYMQIVLDKADLDITGDFEIKVTDNIDLLNGVLHTYDTGDCAPYGRLNYGFKA